MRIWECQTNDEKILSDLMDKIIKAGGISKNL
jgi:hypothetical protein